MLSLAAAHEGVDLEGAIAGVLRSGRYVLGDSVARFEAAFARFCGTEQCIGVANGTDALELALRAIGVSAGDRVITVANAGGYSSAAIRACGAVPVYVDIDPATMTMSAAALRALMASPPAAVIVTHLYGQLADMPAILDAARGIPVVEDCAQAHGATRDGQRAGSFGDIGCFSFYPTKNLGALGDAGAVVTSQPDYAERTRKLRQYGWGDKYDVELEGGRNSRLDELQAAVLLAKLDRLDETNAQRRSIARGYAQALPTPDLVVPSEFEDGHVAHLFVVRTAERDALRAHLRELDIGTEIHYPIADHRQRSIAPDTEPPSLPETESACATVLSLPCYPGLGPDQQGRVIEGVASFTAWPSN